MNFWILKHDKSGDKKRVVIHPESHSKLPAELQKQFTEIPASSGLLPTHIVDDSGLEDMIFFAAINSAEHDHYSAPDLFDSPPVADDSPSVSGDTFGGGDTGGAGGGDDY